MLFIALSVFIAGCGGGSSEEETSNSVDTGSANEQPSTSVDTSSNDVESDEDTVVDEVLVEEVDLGELI